MELKHPQEPVLRWGKLRNCNWLIAGGCVWISLRNKKSRGTQSLGAPHTVWVLPPVVLPGVTVSRGSAVLWQGRGKEPFWNVPEHSGLNKFCPQEKLFNQSLTDLGEGIYPAPAGGGLLHGRWENSAPSSYPFPSKGGRGLKTTADVHSPEVQHHWKTDLFIGL